ncbi:MAG: hypothetical protein CMH27_07295 [Micavibrio sp.]|nr:hypothetical protein [Micavibrio sp.]|tara:strand:+ start:209 stop:484 length:276 start_codon:yes stop_codon:yes gene_type:complete
MTDHGYDHTLDPLIMDNAGDDWQNVTTIISGVFDHAGFDKTAYSAQDIAERVYILVDSGRLDVQGNMRRWREGQVKLRPLLPKKGGDHGSD